MEKHKHTYRNKYTVVYMYMKNKHTLSKTLWKELIWRNTKVNKHKQNLTRPNTIYKNTFLQEQDTSMHTNMKINILAHTQSHGNKQSDKS